MRAFGKMVSWLTVSACCFVSACYLLMTPLTSLSQSRIQLSGPPSLTPQKSSTSSEVQTSTVVDNSAVLRRQYEVIEQRVEQLAAERASASDSEAERTLNALRKSVSEAFHLRQELQRAELAEFRQKLQQIHRSIESREKSADQIIQRRVDELLQAARSIAPPVDVAVPEKIEKGAWGPISQGLSLAVVSTAETTRNDEALKLQLVVKNVSKKAIELRDNRSFDEVITTVRHMSGAQVETRPRGRSGVALLYDPVLQPGDSAVVATRTIRVVSDPTSIPDADLVIVDRKAFDFRNVVYTVRCEIPAHVVAGADVNSDQDSDPALISSGTIAIAFNTPNPARFEGARPSAQNDPRAAVKLKPEYVELETKSVPLPSGDAVKALAELELVFYQDRSRRTVSCLLLDAGGRTVAVTAGSATVVPDGTPPAIDRIFLRRDGIPPVKTQYDSISTNELLFLRTPEKLTSYRLKEAAAVSVGDVLTAVSRNTDSVIVAKLTTVVEVGRQFDFKIATAQHQYENLFEVDSLLREGTPLFKEGKLAGITLLGQRFLGEGTNKSYVVPAERLLAICQKLDAEADAAAGKTLKPAQEISDPDLPPDFKLSGSEVTKESIAKLAGRDWGTVTLMEGAFDGGIIEGLRHARTIRSLRLYGAGLSGQIPRLDNVKGLVELDIGTPFRGRDIEAIGRLTSLERLRLPGEITINVTGAREIARLTRLKSLQLYNINIDDTAFAELQTLVHLEELDLSHTQITDAGLVTIQKMPHLRILELHRHPDWHTPQQLTDACLPSILNRHDLERLSLSGRVTNAALPQLAKLPNLKSLMLMHTEVTGEGLGALENSAVENLTLSSSQVDVEQLKKCRRLRHIHIIGGKFGETPPWQQQLPNISWSFSS